MRFFRFTILFCLLSQFGNLFSQFTFYQDVFVGGVTGAGFSTGVGDGGSGQIIVNISPTSKIKKAFFLCNRYGNANPVNVKLNSKNYIFNYNNQITSDFLTFTTNDTIICALHAIDITSNVSPTQNTYNISFPNQITTSFDKYGAFYLLILYENPVLQKTAISVILNEINATSNVNYKFSSLLPMDTLNPVGLAIHSDIIWDTIQDGSYVFIDGNNFGLIGGSDAVNNLWTGAGVKGHFYYQNDSLFGLDDDTPDSLMIASDGLADIKTYIKNQESSFNLILSTQSLLNQYNIYLAYFLTYTSPCDTFSTTLSKDTSICLGQTAQLFATGGTKYEWLPQQNLSCYNCPNPIFTGTQTTTYTCRIYNNDSCSKVLPVRIIVQNPKADSLKTTKALCPNNNGTAQIFADTLLWGKLNYTINGTANNTGSFTNLTPGWHNYTITDTLGCAVTDSLFIPAQVNVTAAFTSNPKTGFAPLTVNFTNLSNNSTINYWLITNQNNDTLLSTNNFQPSTFNFEQSGTYTTTLIACNNPPYCCDTISFTILVEDSAAILLPNVFSPNQDGVNDDYQIQLQAAWHFETLQAQIYNRWGEVLQERKFTSTINPIPSNITLWDGFTPAGTPATAGTYFIVVNATLKDGKKISSRIAVSLVR